jgi:hypothetical protein
MAGSRIGNGEPSALDALEQFVRAIVRDEAQRLRAESPDPGVWTQHRRPAWASASRVTARAGENAATARDRADRDFYLRAWRALHRAGHAGVTAKGKARLMTEAASEAWLANGASRGVRSDVGPAASSDSMRNALGLEPLQAALRAAS